MRTGLSSFIRSSEPSSLSNRQCPRSFRASSRISMIGRWRSPMAELTSDLPRGGVTHRRFRLVVFDWDGTLADSTALIAGAIQKACQDLGEPVPDDAQARHVIGLGLSDALAYVAPGLARERHRDLALRYRHH